MFRTIALGFLALPALLLASPAAAQGYAFPIDIRPQPLSSALRELARQTSSELLYDRDLVRGMQAPRVKSRLTVEATLRQLLAGTELTVRRASSGAWVIERRRVAPAAPASLARAPAPIDLSTPEILVTARRSQNADIQRRESDVQPYQVTTGEEIVSSHRDNLDQYFRSRVTGNTQVLSPSLMDLGETNSAIDLRGLGIEGTMILVDGRRMPGVPDQSTGLGQPDINAIPLHAIERIETLTGTAGGIHGFGALGGVVNVVLKRDYRGAELHATAGITSRGDARRFALEGRIGFTPDDGATDVMLNLGWSDEDPLLVGQRDYVANSRRLSYSNSPNDLLAFQPNATGIVAAGTFGYGPLVLKPEYGGGALASGHAFLPLGFDGNPATLGATLAQYENNLDFALTDAEATSQMGSNAKVFSAIASVRHDFGGGVEGYFDGLHLRNRGGNFEYINFAQITIAADAPQNPFTDYVTFTFPASPDHGHARTTIESTRLTAGLIVPLPLDWNGTAEATLGSSVRDRTSGTDDAYLGPTLLFGFPDEDPELTPFGNWDDFLRATDKYKESVFAEIRGRNRYQEQSLRLAGPLFSLTDDPASLTLLAQRRREKARYASSLTSPLPEMNGDLGLPSSTIGEESLYAELRLPVFDDAAPVPLLDRLELQLAVRHDRRHFIFAGNPYEPDNSDTFEKRFSGTAFTVGAKLFPLPWLMLRGSYATGVQPPPFNLLIPFELESDRLFLLDPKRGNDYFTDDGPYIQSIGGNPGLETIKARTLSLGAVLNPFGDSGPRLSLDYSRINKTGDPFEPFSSFILEHEDIFPDRVVRGPLTPDDAALGYTAGPILVLDSSVMNAGRVKIETLDGMLDWSVPFAGGTMHLYGAATWQISNELTEPLAPALERVGYAGYPLKLRTNGGFDWSVGPTTFGANLQHFDRYHIFANGYECCTQGIIEMQGSRWVKSQTYVDLYASRRFHIGAVDASVDLGIVNLFDEEQPREVSLYGIGYSMYGDPRRRRFELVLSAEF